MRKDCLVAKHEHMTICIVEPSRFIAKAGDERCPFVSQHDEPAPESVSCVLNAFALAVVVSFVLLFALLGLILLRVEYVTGNGGM